MTIDQKEAIEKAKEEMEESKKATNNSQRIQAEEKLEKIRMECLSQSQKDHLKET